MINSKTKETNKLRTQLEKISKERDQAQAKIGKNLDQCSEVNTKMFGLKVFHSLFTGTLNFESS